MTIAALVSSKISRSRATSGPEHGPLPLGVPAQGVRTQGGQGQGMTGPQFGNEGAVAVCPNVIVAPPMGAGCLHLHA